MTNRPKKLPGAKPAKSVKKGSANGGDGPYNPPPNDKSDLIEKLKKINEEKKKKSEDKEI